MKYDYELRVAELEAEIASYKASYEDINDQASEVALLQKQVEELKEENEKLDRSRDYYKSRYESLKSKQDASTGDK